MATSIITSTRSLSVPRRHLVPKAPRPKLSPGQSPTSSRPVSVTLQADVTSGDDRLGQPAQPHQFPTASAPFGDEPYVPPSLRMRITVSGQLYETRASVFDEHPDSVFGDPVKRRSYWDARRQEYFFDRHRPSFEAVFTYIVEGRRLTRPHNIPVDVFLKEVNIYLHVLQCRLARTCWPNRSKCMVHSFH